MRTEWKQAQQDKAPIVAYLCYSYQLPAFNGNRLVMHKPMVEALTYTADMLERRALRGADVPAWWKVQVFKVGEAA